MSDKYEALRKFAKWVMWTEGDWCGNIDGADIQDKAEELGLIELYTATEPCCDWCMCAEVYDDFPVQCYRYTSLLEDDDG